MELFYPHDSHLVSGAMAILKNMKVNGFRMTSQYIVLWKKMFETTNQIICVYIYTVYIYIYICVTTENHHFLAG